MNVSLGHITHPEDSTFIPHILMPKNIRNFFEALKIPNIRNRIGVLYGRSNDLTKTEAGKALTIWNSFMRSEIAKYKKISKSDDRYIPVVVHLEKLKKSGYVTTALRRRIG
jgi:hypothetical protein